MKWIRIGKRVLNASAIVEAIDEGERDMQTGKLRVVTLKLAGGGTLQAAGPEADAIWDKITGELEVWSETHSPIPWSTKIA
jgi:hypothetical protein